MKLNRNNMVPSGENGNFENNKITRQGERDKEHRK